MTNRGLKSVVRRLHATKSYRVYRPLRYSNNMQLCVAAQIYIFKDLRVYNTCSLAGDHSWYALLIYEIYLQNSGQSSIEMTTYYGIHVIIVIHWNQKVQIHKIMIIYLSIYLTKIAAWFQLIFCQFNWGLKHWVFVAMQPSYILVCTRVQVLFTSKTWLYRWDLYLENFLKMPIRIVNKISLRENSYKILLWYRSVMYYHVWTDHADLKCQHNICLCMNSMLL